MQLDEKDQKIIDCLSINSRQSTYSISKKTAIPITTVHNRIKKLERQGIIKGYTVVLNQKKLGRKLMCYCVLHYNIGVWGKETNRQELKKQLLNLHSIQEVKYITGRFDILLKFNLKDMDEYNDIILNQLRKIPGIGQTETIFVLEDVK